MLASNIILSGIVLKISTNQKKDTIFGLAETNCEIPLNFFDWLKTKNTEFLIDVRIN
jgi:hypothetical protein